MKIKLRLLASLEGHLFKDGRIIIGDVAFESRNLLEQCKVRFLDYWDDEEIYFVFDEFKKSFPNRDISFTPISHCAGIIQLRKLY